MTLIFRHCYLITLVLKGLKRQLGTHVQQSIPFSMDELKAMHATIDMASYLNRILWSVVIFSFRTLLRKSNVVPDSLDSAIHVVRRKDVEFHDWGLMINVASTKTVRYDQYVLHIRIHYVQDKRFCAASSVKSHFQVVPGKPNDPIFLKEPFGKPVLYHDVLSFIKRLATDIGLKGERIGCHSLRRSGAAFLHSIGVPLEDIMSSGDWHSMAVLMYLSTPMSRKHVIQDSVSDKLCLWFCLIGPLAVSLPPAQAAQTAFLRYYYLVDLITYCRVYV